MKSIRTVTRNTWEERERKIHSLSMFTCTNAQTPCSHKAALQPTHRYTTSISISVLQMQEEPEPKL